jgi:polar amino acid transport system substrate-binding protein
MSGVFAGERSRPMRFLNCFVLALITVVFTLPLPGCKEEGGGSADGKKVIVVGTEPTFEPFEYRDESNQIIGFDIDLVRAIAQKQGLEVEFKDFPFDSLIPALNSGQIDMIASGLSITDERRQTIDFSDPYIEAGLALAVRSDEQAIRSAKDLKGRIAAVQRGSTGAQHAEKLKADGILSEVKNYPTVPLAMMELTRGGADVVISDRPTSEAYIARQGQGLKLLDETLVSDSYGFGFRKGNADLQQKINQGLAQVRGEGLIDQLKARYFKGEAKAEAPAAPPPGVTTGQPAAATSQPAAAIPPASTRPAP